MIELPLNPRRFSRCFTTAESGLQQIAITYHLPAKGKSTIHERLFGRQKKEKGGILTKHKIKYDVPFHGELWISPQDLEKVKSILEANKVTYEIGRRQIKHTSYLRKKRRERAADLSDLKRLIRSSKSRRAALRVCGPDAKPDIERLSGTIRMEKESLSMLQAKRRAKFSPEQALAYCRGKASAYVMGNKRTKRKETMKTVSKTIRSILKLFAIRNREDWCLEVEMELEKIGDEVNTREQADRLMKLVRKLRFDTHYLRERVRQRLQKLGIQYP